MLRPPRGLLFDLDGTLIDSAPDLAAALAELFAARGVAPLDVETVHGLIGHGIARLVADAFHHAGKRLPAEELAQARDEMMEAYARNLTARTTLLPGAREIVESCIRRGLPIACVTNKPVAMARAILQHFDLLKHFAVVIGGDSGLGTKPSPAPLLGAAGVLGLPPAELWMVGDALPDMEAAAAAGIVGMAVSSTYGTRPDVKGHALLSLSSLAVLDPVIDYLETVCA